MFLNSTEKYVIVNMYELINSLIGFHPILR